MNRYISNMAIMTLFLAIAGIPAQAAELNTERFYGGGGIGYNELNGDSALGYQFFGGYSFPSGDSEVVPAIEIGYWDSGNIDRDTPTGERTVDATGLWATGLLSVPVADRMSLFGRAGYDFGDDDGLMAGGGLGYDLNTSVSIRGEVVVRDDTDSLQLNAVYWF